jgi:hypothetical protein
VNGPDLNASTFTVSGYWFQTFLRNCRYRTKSRNSLWVRKFLNAERPDGDHGGPSRVAVSGSNFLLENAHMPGILSLSAANPSWSA